MSSLGRRDLEKEACSFRRAALEFRELLRKKSMSTNSTWNASVRECMALFGDECIPKHGSGECQKCWVLEKLRGVLRLDNSPYITLKERLTGALERMRKTSTLKGSEHDTYFMAISDISRELDKIVEDFE